MTSRSGVQAEPATLAGLVGVLSLNGQQPLAAALQQKALDLQHAPPPMHSHFRPCWAERGAAVGLPMKPHIGQVAVEVPTEKLSRCVQLLHAFLSYRCLAELRDMAPFGCGEG